MMADSKSEVDACTEASQRPNLDIATNAERPCWYEACHPQGCGSNMIVDNADCINCGCPDSCAINALQEKKGATSKWNCKEQIKLLMWADSKSEVDACTEASQHPDLDIATNAERPCRYEACHPQGCGSNMIVDNADHINCRCPNSCTINALQEKNGATVGS
jgi:hypothetical protein